MPLTLEWAIRMVITMLYVAKTAIDERDYGSGKSFITSPVAIYFLLLLGNDDVIYEVIYGVIVKKFKTSTGPF